MNNKEIKVFSKDDIMDNFAMATSAYVMGNDLSFTEMVELTNKLRLIVDIALDFMFTETIKDKELRDQVIKIKNSFKGDKTSDNN